MVTPRWVAAKRNKTKPKNASDAFWAIFRKANLLTSREQYVSIQLDNRLRVETLVQPRPKTK